VKRLSIPLLLALPLLLAVGCDNHPKDNPPAHSDGTPQATGKKAPEVTTPIPSRPAPPPGEYTYEVVRQYPHDHKAYTQGLEIRDGTILESTGLYGESTLREVDLKSGRILRKIDIDPQYFAEGATLFKGKVYQLTWRGHIGFIYDPSTFNRTGSFSYEGEGWGLTNNGQFLIMSDGTNMIRFIDPDNLVEMGRVSVFDDKGPVDQLNELEFINGEVWANVYMTNRIVRIDPYSGRVVGSVDMTGLLSDADRAAGAEVLNGIAYDAKSDRLFVTGKRWPKLFEITLKPKSETVAAKQ